ncbi:hypothetical protein KR044_008412 [Drosophila immigrans]|nr:hypothetical protein KR044_008412 [Drosophila immigrans]
MSLEQDNSLILAQELAATAEEEKTEGDDANCGDGKAELDIVINNVVCSFSVKCHLNLHDIALNGVNVEYRRENSMLTMRLRRPYTTASIWSSGKITCTGATSEVDAKIAARRFARSLQKLGFPVGFHNFRIYNVLGTCTMPWAIRIVQFSERHRNNASYEPELHPGVTYRMNDPTATLKIFSTGSITVTAQNVATVDLAIQRIYDLVYEFRNDNNRKEEALLRDRLSKTPRQPTLGAPRIASTTWRSKPQAHSSMKFLDTIPNTKGSETNTTNTVTVTSNSCGNGENIFSNARRRATERWVTKLQEKQSRFTDSTTYAKTSSFTRPRGVIKTPTKPLLPSNRQLNPNNFQNPNVLTRAITNFPPAKVSTATPATNPSLVASSSIQLIDPTDFEVDDLIEEIDEDDMDWQI